MTITYIGHSCFKLQHNGSSVIFDPYEDGYVPGLENIEEEADLVLCSHDHGDHNAKGTVKLTGKPHKFDVTFFDTYHDDVQGKKRGMNRVHIIKTDGYKVVHMGDIGCSLTAEQTAAVKGADLVLIPVGGFYTINAVQALQMVKQIEPKTIIPMHYRSEGIGFEQISTLDEFVNSFDDVYYADSEFTLNNQSIVILTPKNRS